MKVTLWIIHTNLTNSLLISVGMYMYSRTCSLILITSPATILNLPINFLCPLDTALVLTSDNLHLVPHPSPISVSQPPGGNFKNHSHGHHLYRIFTYIYSLLIEKGICNRWNISSFHVYFRLKISSFFGKFSLSFPIYWVKKSNYYRGSQHQVPKYKYRSQSWNSYEFFLVSHCCWWTNKNRKNLTDNY